jgi:hypothetical protein
MSGQFFCYLPRSQTHARLLAACRWAWSPPPADELINKDKGDVVNWQHHDDAKWGVGAVAAATRSSHGQRHERNACLMASSGM